MEHPSSGRPPSPEPAPAPSWDDVVRELRRPPVDEDPRGRHRVGRRRPRFRARTAVVVLMVVVLAGWWVRGAVAEPPSGAPAPVVTSWADVLEVLDLGRTRAWESGDASALGRVDVPGSAAERADRAVLDALARDDVRPEGMRLTVETVGVITKAPDAVRLRVVDRRSAYVLRDGDGRVVSEVPERGRRAWEVALARDGERWRVAETVAL